MTWQERPLGDCVTFASGGTPNKAKPEYWNGEIPWVSSGEMSRHFIEDTSLHITEAGAEAGSRLVAAGTVFAVVRGMSLATEFRLACAARTMAFNQDVKALTVKDGIDSYFLFSSLRAHANQIRDLSTEAAHGTKKLEMERLASFRIPVPEVGAQRRAADVVRNYDDLIESNRRRITLLEESARLLYREWFVNLRFPGHEQAHFKNGLPDDWSVVPLTDVAEVNRRNLNSKAAPDSIQYVDIASVETGCVRQTAEMTFADAPGRARRLVQQGDVIWSCVRPNRKSYALIREPAANLVVSSGFAVLTATRVPSTYLYLTTTSDAFVAFLSNRATGAAYPAVTAKDFEAAQVLRPDHSVLQEFDDRYEPIFALIHTLREQNKRLTLARDELLPKLMSGAIRV